jgi:hypothetical protein
LIDEAFSAVETARFSSRCSSVARLEPDAEPLVERVVDVCIALLRVAGLGRQKTDDLQPLAAETVEVVRQPLALSLHTAPDPVDDALRAISDAEVGA